MSETLRHIQEQLQGVQKAKALNDRSWERLLEHLRDREEQDLDRDIVEPLLRQLILLYDRVSQPECKATKNLIEGIQKEVLGILAMYGVETVTPPGPRFESRFQKCIGHRDAVTQSAEGIVAERVRTGFRRGERILRFEEVLVWRYQDPYSPNAEEQP